MVLMDLVHSPKYKIIAKGSVNSVSEANGYLLGISYPLQGNNLTS